MKRFFFFAAFCLFCLIAIVGLTSSGTKRDYANMYVCVMTDGTEYLTIRKDSHFFYVRPAINRSIAGRVHMENDTLILYPEVQYYFENDSIVADVVQGMPVREIPDPFWAIKLLTRKSPQLHLIDVTDYSAIFPDSVLPPSLPGREFKWVK